MKIYFLSSRRCALKLGGAYFGITDKFERFAEISPKDNIFAEFIPEDALPISFFITEKLRFEPPARCEVYLLKDGVAVYAKHFPPSDLSLQILLQERFNASLVTVFRQGELEVSLETPHGFFISTLPPSFAPRALKYAEGLFLIEGEGELLIFNQKGENVFEERIKNYRIEGNTLKAVLPLSDHLQREGRGEWSLSPDGCVQTSFTIAQKNDGKDDLSSALLLYSFLESVLIGCDPAPFLSDELKGKLPRLKDFLGAFVSVLPTDDPFVCALVRPKKERLFELIYIAAEVKEGQIVDLTQE